MRGIDSPHISTPDLCMLYVLCVCNYLGQSSAMLSQLSAQIKLCVVTKWDFRQLILLNSVLNFIFHKLNIQKVISSTYIEFLCYKSSLLVGQILENMGTHWTKVPNFCLVSIKHFLNRSPILQCTGLQVTAPLELFLLLMYLNGIKTIPQCYKLLNVY